MCGIAGIIHFDGSTPDAARLDAMQSALAHRGPDGADRFIDAAVGLVHTRLAILDLTSRGAQPMISSCGRYVLTYNGEAYNFHDLRRELERSGATFRTSTDTEVVLEGIAAHGVDAFIPRIEGFFAFALWDRTERRMTLVRDRFGIKPLSYRLVSGRRFEFASECKALVHEHAEPDLASISSVLLGLGGTWGPNTLFRDIHRVEPGEILEVDATGRVASRRFFVRQDWIDPALHDELKDHNDRAIISTVESAFQRSIDFRLTSDAPIGCLLSGGVDSSLIAATASRRVNDLPVYHADVVHASETAAAERTADSLGLQLRTYRVTDADFLEHLAAVTHFHDAPINYHPNSIPFYLISQLAAEDGVKVLLTGEGSDEFWLGYPRTALRLGCAPYFAARDRFVKAFRRVAPTVARRIIADHSNSVMALHRSLLAGFEHECATNALARIPKAADRNAMREALHMSGAHLSTLLHRNDRLAMAWGVESRFPFLGSDLVRLALNLPRRAKLRWSCVMGDTRHPFLIDKWCVREIAKTKLPSSLARRPKRGFPISVYEELHVAPDLFKDGFVANWFRLPRRGIEHLTERAPRQWLAQLMFIEVWARLFVQRRSVDDVHEFIMKNAAIGRDPLRRTEFQIGPAMTRAVPTSESRKAA